MSELLKHLIAIHLDIIALLTRFDQRCDLKTRAADGVVRTELRS